jgi:hypothetical protein
MFRTGDQVVTRSLRHRTARYGILLVASSLMGCDAPGVAASKFDGTYVGSI